MNISICQRTGKTSENDGFLTCRNPCGFSEAFLLSSIAQHALNFRRRRLIAKVAPNSVAKADWKAVKRDNAVVAGVTTIAGRCQNSGWSCLHAGKRFLSFGVGGSREARPALEFISLRPASQASTGFQNPMWRELPAGAAGNAYLVDAAASKTVIARPRLGKRWALLQL